MATPAASQGYYADAGQLKDHSVHLKPIYEAGETITWATPYAFIVKSSWRGDYCHNCISPATGERRLTKCTDCEFVSYCGPDCRREASAFHRHECPLLAKWRLKDKTWAGLLDKTRLLFSVLARRQIEGRGAPGFAVEGVLGDAVDEGGFPRVQGAGWRPSFDDLLSHAEDLERNPGVYLPVLENLAEFCGAEQLAFEFPPPKEIVAIYGRIRSNWCDLCDGHLKRMGEAIYLSISVINHSCLASATLITYGLRVEMRTLRKIEAAKEEPRYNYVLWEHLPTTEERQEYFKFEYYFECKCPLCDGSAAAKKRDKRLKSGRCIYGEDCRLKTECDYCLAGESGSSTDLAAAYAKVKDVLTAMEDAAEKADHRSVIALATAYLSEAHELGVCNWEVVKIREKLVSACYELEDSWHAGIEAGLVLLDVYLLIYPAWPTIPMGKLRFMMGVLLLRGGRSGEAAEQFQRALDIMEVILGSKHDYVKEIKRQQKLAADGAAGVESV